MDRAEAAAYRRRWRLVEERKTRELRELDIETSFRELVALFSSASVFPESPDRARGEEEVRNRWQRLRRLWHGRA